MCIRDCNSALHIPQYFSSTYNFERIRYAEYQFSDLQINDFTEQTSLYCQYALDQDDCPQSDKPSKLLLPKEFYSLVDQTQNKFPTWGFVTEYDFHYKELFSGNVSFSMFKEISESQIFFSSAFNQCKWVLCTLIITVLLIRVGKKAILGSKNV